MFRRTSTKRSTDRDFGVKFCDGYGISTRAERSDRRLEAARASAAMIGRI
jgi:hypothetical protein